MNILLILQLVQAELFTIRQGEIKSLFALPANAQDLSLQSDNDIWDICYIQNYCLDLEYFSNELTNNATNLAMVSLSQHSMLVITDDHQINYLQDQTLLWQIKLPQNMNLTNITMRYCQATYMVYLISDKVHYFNPYNKKLSEPDLFLEFRPQQLEIQDAFIFVLHDSVINIYDNFSLIYTVNFRNNSSITYFSLTKSDDEKYIIYLTDKQYGLIQVQWMILSHQIIQMDLIQNGIMLGCSNVSNIFVIYQRQFKYIIAQYRIAESQYQIVKKMHSRTPIKKIIATKDFTLFLGQNKISLLYENHLYSINKFGIRDISMLGVRITGISAFESFQYFFKPMLASIVCFYSIDQSMSLHYSLTYSQINKTIQKQKIDFGVELEKRQQNFMKFGIILLIIGIILMMIIVYSYLIFKQRMFTISNLENNVKKCKVKQIPLFKSLECVISPKGQHSKLQSFDQTSNFDLMRK